MVTKTEECYTRLIRVNLSFMTLRLAFPAAAVGAALFFLFSLVSINPAFAATGDKDYGDAPDGGPTYYTSGAATGSFPSLEASDGARTNKTDNVWLGRRVDQESDSRQVDEDLYDDGVGLNLNRCAKSKAYVFVHVENPGEMSGTGYINLFFDWNKDGEWSGEDSCGADEWAVRNFPVDLSAQQRAIKVYIPEFRGGDKVKNVWYRAVVTKNERMVDESGIGSFRIGEVEDYGPAPAIGEDDDDDGGGKEFGAVCKPRLLVIKHGEEGRFRIVKRPGSVAITETKLTNSVTPETADRRIRKVFGNVFSYKSKEVHHSPPVWETVEVRTRFGTTASIVKKCRVVVVHSGLRGFIQNVHDRTFTNSPVGSYTVERLNNGQQSRVTATLETIPTEMVALDLTGMKLPLPNQHPTIDPNDFLGAQVYLNGSLLTNDWSCYLDGSNVICQGLSPMHTGPSVFQFLFNGDLSVDRTAALHLHGFANNEVLAAIDLPQQ
jgi:hypothetical protein